MARKIIQLAAVSTNIIGTSERYPMLFALADDGTLWCNPDPTNVDALWERAADLPQDDAATPTDPASV